MDRIEERLQELVDEQDAVTFSNAMMALCGDNPVSKASYAQRRDDARDTRDALRNGITADFRAMVAALDNALWLLGTDEDRRNIGDLHLSSVYMVPGMLRTTLARVKGE